MSPFWMENSSLAFCLQWLLVGVFIAVFIRVTFTVVYRIWFHPLARFPGPVLAKITDLWSVYQNIRGDVHLAAYECHKAYGPIVRYGPNKLSISSISGIYDTYDAKALSKSEVYETITPAPGAWSCFTAIDKDIHRRKRKVYSQAFSDRALREFEPTVLEHVDIFIRELTKLIPANDYNGGWSEPVDMTSRTRYFATDVMGDFGFGKSFDMQTGDENKFLLKAADGAGFVAGIYTLYPKLKRYGLGKLVAIAGMATKERFGKFSKRLIEQRLGEPNEKKRDILHYLTQPKDDYDLGQPDFTMDEIWAESRFTLIAGAETTGTAVAACLWYLSQHPGYLRRLTKTLRSTFRSKDDIKSGDKLSTCEHLWACVDESMRLSPSIVGILWRQVCDEGFTIDGEPIPKGCDVGVSSYVPHHDPDVFSEPFAFRPERWLITEGAAERIRLQRRAFIPFSQGSRKCIGAKMAMTNIALCLARTLWTLDMKRADGEMAQVGGGKAGKRGRRGDVKEFQLFDHITSRHEGPFLQWSYRRDYQI